MAFPPIMHTAIGGEDTKRNFKHAKRQRRSHERGYPDNVYRAIECAELAHRAGSLPNCRVWLGRAGKLVGEDMFAQARISIEQIKAGDLQTAETGMRRVLASAPNLAAGYLGCGMIARRRREWKDSLKFLEQARSMDPHNVTIRMELHILQNECDEIQG